MKKIILWLFVFSLLHPTMQAQEVPIPQKGILNLSKWNFDPKKSIELTGTWEFYWHQLLNPHNFKIKADSMQRIFIKVPDNWNAYTLHNKSIPAFGYGTYRLKIIVKGNPDLFLKIMGVSSAYKIWANQKLLGEVGKVDSSKALYNPEYKPESFSLQLGNIFPKDSIHTVEILIQVANFYHVNSGIWELAEIGTFKSLNTETKKELIVNAIILGILLMVVFYYLILFLLHKNELSNIYLSLFALTMSFRSISVDNRIILDIIPDLNYFALIRIEYLSAYINIIFVSLFFYNLFKNQHHKIVIKIIVILGIIFGLIILFTPVHFFTSLRDVYNLYVILSSGYIAYYSLFKALLKRETGAIAAYIGMFVMLGTAIMDIITTIAVLPLPQLAPAGLVFYILMQAIVLAQRFSKTFKENEYLNKNLAGLVEKKTLELKEEKEELLSAEEELRQNNEELLVLNENIVSQKKDLERANIGLQGQAAMSKILQRVTDSKLNIQKFLQFALDVVLDQHWFNILRKGSIFVTNKEGNLEMLAQRDLGILVKTCALIKPGQCLCGKALKEKKLLFHDCLDSNHEIRPEGIQEHGHYNIPLIFEDKVVGVVNLYVEHKHISTKLEKDFLIILSEVLASVIQRKQIQKALDQQTNLLIEQNDELLSLKDSIEQQKSQLQRVIENQGEGFALIDLAGNFVYTNSSAQNILKTTKEALLKQNMRNFVNPKILEKIKLNFEKLNSQEKYNFEEIIQTANKDLIFLQSTITQNYNNVGKKIGYIVNFRDITELKKAEDNLKTANIALKKYFVAIEQSPLTIVITDTKARIEYVNPAFTTISGYSLGEVKITPRLLQSGKTPPETYKSLWQTITKGEIWEGEFINKKINGEEYVERAIIAPINNDEGKIINYVAIKEDITEKKEHELQITKQHKQIELALRKINDSINYAKKLQKGLLNKDKFKKILNNEFSLLFMPKNQVSGDFYYIHKIKNRIVFAVADCTGHGVPGAILSVLSYSFLDEIIRNKNFNNPAFALESMREKIKLTFTNGAKDGLDIALCSIDTQTNTIQYAGAYNPLIILRNNKIIELKANLNPIGYYKNEKPFELHNLLLKDKDRIYLFSDGFIDQFGGFKNRKFMRKPFYNVLEELSDIPIEEQSSILNQIFTKWRGKNEQIDDITVLGIEWSIKKDEPH